MEFTLVLAVSTCIQMFYNVSLFWVQDCLSEDINAFLLKSILSDVYKMTKDGIDN